MRFSSDVMRLGRQWSATDRYTFKNAENAFFFSSPPSLLLLWKWGKKRVRTWCIKFRLLLFILVFFVLNVSICWLDSLSLAPLILLVGVFLRDASWMLPFRSINETDFSRQYASSSLSIVCWSNLSIAFNTSKVWMRLVWLIFCDWSNLWCCFK